MNARLKSVLLLVGVLIVGLALGTFGTSALQHRRMAALQEARREGGLMQRLERVIEFENESQREEIEDIVLRAETNFRTIQRSCGDSLSVYREAFLADLKEVLTPDQHAQVETWLQRDRELRSHRRGRSADPRTRSRERP